MAISTSCKLEEREASQTVVDPFQGVHRRCFADSDTNCATRDPLHFDGDLPPLSHSMHDHPHFSHDGASQCISNSPLRDCCFSLVAGASVSCRQFLYGFIFRCCSGFALELALVGGLELVNLLSPGTGVAIRLALISWLRLFGYAGTTTREVLVTPFLLVACIPLYVLKSIFGTTTIIVLISDVTMILCMAPGRQMDFLAHYATIPFPSWIVRAICEEVTFRRILNWPLWLCRRLSTNWNSLSSQRKEEKSMLQLHALWVLLKGLCFGAMHIDHWLSSGIENANPKDQLGAISGATHQTLWCFLASVRIYDPLATKYGLAAAIGAHVTHNALGFGLRAALRTITGTKG